MKSSPIYCRIDNPARKSDCSFGARGRFSQEICVGTSASNSHSFANITVEQHQLDDGTMRFNMWLGGTLVRSGILDGTDFRFDKHYG